MVKEPHLEVVIRVNSIDLIFGERHLVRRPRPRFDAGGHSLELAVNTDGCPGLRHPPNLARSTSVHVTAD